MNEHNDRRLEMDAGFLAGFMSDYFFPDCYLNLPLKGETYEGIALSLDCYERCYLDDQSGGTFFKQLGVSPLNEPENRDDIMLIRVKDGDYLTEILDRKKAGQTACGQKTEPDELAAQYTFFKGLQGLPIECFALRLGEEHRITVTSGNVHARSRFKNKPYHKAFLEMLAQAGVSREGVAAADGASFNFGIPYYDKDTGYQEWISCIDVVSFVFNLRGSEVTGCSMNIRISDKCISAGQARYRRMQAYQWHITDLCDLRCRHCYLFAEDALKDCKSAPYDQMMLTLDQIMEDAAIRNAIPRVCVSGGDPILHPQFWRFAEELHRRGVYWDLMGNPFHLSKDVCERLYRLGCMAYQMSLDGLQAYHDHMRRPGAFDAVMEGIGLINDSGMESVLMATVSRQNMKDVLACMDIAAEHRVSVFGFARYCATSPENAASAYPSPQEYREFLIRYFEKAKYFKETNCHTSFALKDHLFTLLRYELGEFKPPKHAMNHPERIFDGCHLGQALAILPNGDVMACRRMESVVGNVNTDSIHEIVLGERCKRYLKIGNIKKCKDCELLNWCRGCRAVGFNVTGDLMCEDPCCWKE